MKDPIARAQVLVTDISLRDMQVNMYDKNPYLHPGKEDVETTRLYVRNIPLSYDNDVITDYLKNMWLEMLGSLKYVRARTPEGKLTNFKTGDRFVEIVVPDEPFQRRKQWGFSQPPCTTRNKNKQQMRLSEEIVDKPGTSVEIVRMKQCVMTASNLGTERAVRFAPACRDRQSE